MHYVRYVFFDPDLCMYSRHKIILKPVVVSLSLVGLSKINIFPEGFLCSVQLYMIDIVLIYRHQIFFGYILLTFVLGGILS